MEAALAIAGFATAAALLWAGAQLLRDQPRRLWAASWAAVLALGFSTGIGWAPMSVAVFLGAVFSAGQLAGAFAFTRGRTPAWVVPLGLAMGLAAATELTLGGPGLLVALRLVSGPLLTLAAAGVLLRAEPGLRSSRKLLALPLLLALAALGEVLHLATFTPGAPVPHWLEAYWVTLLIVGFTLQLHVEDDAALRSGDAIRHAAQRERDLERERFRALTESAFDLVAELDENERFTYVSPRYLEVLGHAPQSLLGRPARELLHPDDLPGTRRFASSTFDAGRASGFLARVRHRDGHYLWMEHAARGFVTPQGERRFVLSSRDAASRQAQEASGKRARDLLRAQVWEQLGALEESEARFRALADYAPELISEFDEKGSFIFANASYKELLGVAPETLIGRTPDQLLHPDDLDAFRESLRRKYHEEGTSRGLYRLRCADGSWRWFEITGRAYRSANDELRFVSIGHDVTEARRRAVERRRLEERVQQAQRRESLALLAGGIAHDFNNLLAVILGNAELLKTGPDDEAERRRRVGRIHSAAAHGSALTRQLLAYTGQSSRTLRQLDPGRFLLESRMLLGAAAGPRCHLEMEIEREGAAAPDLPAVEADATELRQVLVNLVTNAKEALGAEGGTIRVRATRAPPALPLPAQGPATAASSPPWVALEVADDGPGMPASLRQRILEPFYSTKASGRGLGLAVVHGIVTAHHGLLQVESTPGAGSLFRVLLPPSTGAARAAPGEPQRSSEPAMLGRVLVVDDDDAVRELAQIFLESSGFQVETVNGGREALERIGKRPRVDCVLLDLAMPDMNGAEVLRTLRRRSPRLAVVVGTGFADELAREQLTGQEAYLLLHKPYGPEQLAASISQAIRDARR